MEDKVLGICSYCKSIRINDESNIWLSKDTNSNLYDKFIERYTGKLSHSYCPECSKRVMKQLDNEFSAGNKKPEGLVKKTWPLEIGLEYFR